MNTKFIVFVFIVVACASAAAALDTVENNGDFEHTSNLTTTVISRVKRGGDKGCNTLNPICLQTMCNQCCNEGCKGQDCWQPMCSLCCS